MQITWETEQSRIFGSVEYLTVGDVDVGNMRHRVNEDGRYAFVGYANGIGFISATAKTAERCKASVIRQLRKAGVPC